MPMTHADPFPFRSRRRVRPVAAQALMPVLLLAALAAPMARAQADAPKTVYRCPGDPVLYTDALTPQQAKERGCKPIENAPVTIVQTNRPRPPASGDGGEATGTAPPPPSAQARVAPDQQRERDRDARRILQGELQREQEALVALRTEYNDGQPERRGDERNYQRYLDRVAELKASIARKEADIAAIRRELAKLPP
jgi:hypothetical protein